MGVFKGTYTCRPLEPEVLAKHSSPKWLKICRTHSPTWQHCTMLAGAPGSRSNTSMVGCRISLPSDNEVCSSMSARLAAHTSVGRSCTRQYFIQRLLPSLHTSAVCTQSGRCDGQFFS